MARSQQTKRLALYEVSILDDRMRYLRGQATVVKKLLQEIARKQQENDDILDLCTAAFCS